MTIFLPSVNAELSQTNYLHPNKQNSIVLAEWLKAHQY